MLQSIPSHSAKIFAILLISQHLNPLPHTNQFFYLYPPMLNSTIISHQEGYNLVPQCTPPIFLFYTHTYSQQSILFCCSIAFYTLITFFHCPGPLIVTDGASLLQLFCFKIIYIASVHQAKAENKDVQLSDIRRGDILLHSVQLGKIESAFIANPYMQPPYEVKLCLQLPVIILHQVCYSY